MAQKRPVVYRKRAKRACRLAKAAMAAEAIGTIQPGTDVMIMTFGQFSLIDALVHIIEQIGPADVDLATWTAYDTHLERSAELVESSEIKRFRMVVDRSFYARNPDFYGHMVKLFGPECVRELRIHAKFMVLRSARSDVVVRTSMNLNENRRLENIEISEDAGLADFMVGLVDGIFDEAGEGDHRSAMLELAGHADCNPFKEIQADLIPREHLNVANATHAIKKL